MQLVRQAAGKKILFLRHAVSQMSRPDRMISFGDVRAVIQQGELIEEYPKDSRGHSGLILGKSTDGRSIHVVCAPKDDYLAVITAYVPSKQEWESGFRRRKK
ncbi:MAG: hypothetical protein A3A86_07205 [Elusimicrobia bacterium RIFCSPLOWO2_01_FULL_60_11]|nr:MAG: hypothetical protein A3A86_07205 [Elusimicrobia bacterium RIFCSPLOWO2_01_FULL_60_11]